MTEAVISSHAPLEDYAQLHDVPTCVSLDV